MRIKKVYLDYAATTPVDPQVKKAMEPYWSDRYGNPSSIHSLGVQAKKAVENARSICADILNAAQQEIIFTGGGTEAVNLALLGFCRRYKEYGAHIIVSAIEHHAVLEACRQLELEGFKVDYLPVDKEGVVEPKLLADYLRKETILIGIMYANNEIGTIQPLSEIAKVIRKFRKNTANLNSGYLTDSLPKLPHSFPYLFTDACQAAGALALDVERLGVDMLALSGSKIYGPKGVGMLYLKRGIELEPLVYGGGQERGFRSGTENVPAIVGFAKALFLVDKKKSKESLRLMRLRDYFIKKMPVFLPEAVLNGHPTKRLPNNINISIPGIEGDTAVVYLDAKGIAVSTGAACSSVSMEPSHVLLALGRTKELAIGSLRITMGRYTTKKGIDYLLNILPGVISLIKKV